jgi:hypothetical protein
MSSVSRRNRGPAAGDVSPPGPPCLQQFLPPVSSSPVQLRNELQRIRSKHLVLPANGLRGQRNAVDGEAVSKLFIGVLLVHGCPTGFQQMRVQ